jgi:predicted nucleic acid-binding protein
LIVVDTSGLLALYDRSARVHAAVTAVVEADDGPLVLSPFVLAELYYLVAARLGPRHARAVLADVANNTYELAPFSTEDVGAANAILTKYEDLGIGLTDASIVVLAQRYGTNRVLTLDERDFRALRVKRKTFAVLPADSTA